MIGGVAEAEGVVEVTEAEKTAGKELPREENRRLIIRRAVWLPDALK
jgi:hypothetical protein